jgi:TonB dependent receptor/CarboxypepD_reg-like domain/TonB-dependent Receptor Plug Domain
LRPNNVPMNVNFRLILLFSILSFLFSNANAQEKGIIYGNATDKYTQMPAAGASVTIEGSDEGTITDSIGNYKLTTSLGTKNITITYSGFGSQTKYNIVVSAGNAQIVNFELQPEAKSLKDVVISIDKNKSARAADMVTPMSTQKLTSEEIKSNPGGNFDVSKVIQVLPGVSGGSQANRNDIIVRGGAPNENVYYLDGIEIPVLNHFQTQGASGGATGILNVSFIEEVQLTSSAFDARYDNALSSTFVIKQRQGNPEKVSGNVRLSASEVAATLEGPIDKKTTFMASARRSYLQYLFQALDLPIRPQYWDFQFKVTRNIDKKTTLNLIGIGAIDKFRLAVPKKSSPENEYILRSNPDIDQWTYTVGASLKRLVNNGYISLALSRDVFNNEANQFEDGQVAANTRTLGLKSSEIENKLRLDVNKYVSGWKFSYGVMAQFVNYKSSLFNRVSNEIKDQNGNVISPAVTISFNSHIDFAKYGAFAQLSKRFFDNKLLLSGGARTDMNSFTNDGNSPLKTLSPRLSFSYNIIPKWDITGSIGSYFKIPVYTNLGFRNNAGELVNKNLEYIQSTHYAIGFQFIPKNDFRLTLEGFYKEYSHYPTSVRTGISLANQGADFTAVGNEAVLSNGKGTTYGLEFFAQQKLIKQTFYAVSATIYKSEFSGKNGGLLPSSWDFGYLVSATLGQKFKKNWEAGLKYRLAGGAPYTPFDPIASRANYITTGVGMLDYNEINSLRLKPFQQVDLRVDKKYNFKKTSLNLYLDFQNVLVFTSEGVPNYTFKRNADNSGFETTDGNSIKADGSNAIPIILKNDNTSLLPTIGFIFEF